MGALRDPARSFGDELGDYYVAALEFIDPALVADSPLAEILTAADRRRRKLGERPLYQVEDELNALDEALHFVQRVRSDIPSTTKAGSAEYIDVDVDGSRPEGTTPSELWAQAMSPAPPEPPAAEPAGTGTRDSAVPQPGLFTPTVTAQSAPEPPAPAASSAPEEWRIPADRTRARRIDQPAAKPGPASVTGKSLRRVMEQARENGVAEIRLPVAKLASAAAASTATAAKPLRPVLPLLPESAAWPAVAGLLLIVWQAWLAVFAGWSATRFFVWPRPGIGYELGWAPIAGLTLLALATAAVIARGAWVYRRRTRCLTGLVHLSAVVVLADLIAWGLAARKLGALIDGPVNGYYVMLAVAWGLGWLLSGVHDAAVRRMIQRQSPGREGCRS